MVRFLLMFSKCSFALMRRAAIELVRMSVLPDCWLIVMLMAAPAPSLGSSGLNSEVFLSGDGDLKAKLCDGDCCCMLCDGLMVDDDDCCCCIMLIDAAEDTGMAAGGKCEGGPML